MRALFVGEHADTVIFFFEDPVRARKGRIHQRGKHWLNAKRNSRHVLVLGRLSPIDVMRSEIQARFYAGSCILGAAFASRSGEAAKFDEPASYFSAAVCAFLSASSGIPFAFEL